MDIGVTVKGMSKFSKKPSIIDEDKRNTYSLSLQSLLEREPSIVAAFQDKRKQLIPVSSMALMLLCLIFSILHLLLGLIYHD